jgi:hypothetical protein
VDSARQHLLPDAGLAEDEHAPLIVDEQHPFDQPTCPPTFDVDTPDDTE